MQCEMSKPCLVEVAASKHMHLARQGGFVCWLACEHAVILHVHDETVSLLEAYRSDSLQRPRPYLQVILTQMKNQSLYQRRSSKAPQLC